MFLNASIPEFHCLLREEFLYNLESHHGGFVPVCVFGIASVSGRALGFHVLTEGGAQIARVPIHALLHKREAPDLPLDHLQLWNCFSYDVAVTEVDEQRLCLVRGGSERAFCAAPLSRERARSDHHRGVGPDEDRRRSRVARLRRDGGLEAGVGEVIELYCPACRAGGQ